jgi:hypothetical protein
MTRSIIVCMLVTDLAIPPVESKEQWCTICAEPVWISLNALKVDADPVCQECAMGIPGYDEAPVEVPPEVRETLHAEGYTDEMIDEVLEYAKTMMKHRRKA